MQSRISSTLHSFWSLFSVLKASLFLSNHQFEKQVEIHRTEVGDRQPHSLLPNKEYLGQEDDEVQQQNQFVSLLRDSFTHSREVLEEQNFDEHVFPPAQHRDHDENQFLRLLRIEPTFDEIPGPLLEEVHREGDQVAHRVHVFLIQNETEEEEHLEEELHSVVLHFLLSGGFLLDSVHVLEFLQSVDQLAHIEALQTLLRLLLLLDYFLGLLGENSLEKLFFFVVFFNGF